MNILAVGKVFGVDVKKYNKLGHKVYCVFHNNPKVGNKSALGLEGFWEIDAFNNEEISSWVESVKEDYKFDAVVNFFEQFVPIKAIIAESLNLPGISFSAAQLASDKVLMRDAFTKKYPEITPQFQEVTTLAEAESFAGEYGYPVMLKPANLAKSLLVLKCVDKTELEENWKLASSKIAELYERKSGFYKPKILVEEFMEGMLYSVDLMADASGEIYPLMPVQLFFAKDVGIDDTHNYSRFLPPITEIGIESELKDAAIKAAKAIGLTNSPGHVELVATKNGVKVVEIGARWGGYRSLMYDRALGLDPMKIELEVLSGKKPTLEPSKKVFNAVIEIFSLTEGRYSRIKNLDKLLKLKTYYKLINNLKPGDEVGLAKNGYSYPIAIKLVSEDRDQLLSDYEFIRKNISVELAQE